MAGQALPELRTDFYALLRRADNRIAGRHIADRYSDSADHHIADRRLADLRIADQGGHARPTVAGADQHPGSRGESRFAHYVTGLHEKIFSIVLGAALTAVIVFGWMKKEQGYLAPDHGLGRWLGIAGLVALLALLIYPLRKRRQPAPVGAHQRFWSRAHMALALVAPTLVLFHANFRPGMGNSKVALLAMLMVAASALIGRYLHGKVHLGRYGRKATMREILSDADSLRTLLGERLPLSELVVSELNTFVRIAMAPRRGLLARLCRIPALNLHTYAVRRRLRTQARQLIKSEAKRRGWSWRMRRERLAGAVELMTMHVAAVKKAAQFTFYQRLFGIWRIMQVPLFVLVVLTAAKHAAEHFH